MIFAEKEKITELGLKMYNQGGKDCIDNIIDTLNLMGVDYCNKQMLLIAKSKFGESLHEDLR